MKLAGGWLATVTCLISTRLHIGISPAKALQKRQDLSPRAHLAMYFSYSGTARLLKLYYKRELLLQCMGVSPGLL